MNNIFVLDKNYNKIGTLSNQGVKPLAPYFNDLFVQDLETGADTYEFSTISNSYTQGCIEIGNHIMFAYRNRNELFTITSIEHSHNEGYKTVGVYAESVGFELLDIYMEKPKVSETDKDDDDDSNKDNGGSDKVYIDENGNIIYDPDGDGSTGGDITIDGNGNIIYKPKDEKKNKNSDSLEFKNISYPTFIKMILKNTGWSYVCQPGLEKNKQDIHVSYDTNIFAILQDSMQSYKGVELEFRYEYNNGQVTKTVYAYNDGGRGSFIGKRFVYGQNVKGITKTQEVTHEKDDAIIFIDNIGVEVRYDVDFALKSAEVPEIEIGDTHYVIDSDFHPPMQIKARIGKIEVSFSDPTRNKIYLANNKKMKGSLVDDGLDSYNDDDGGDGEGHNRLVCDCWDNTTVMEFHGSYSPDYPDFIPGDNVPEGEIQFRTSYMNVDFHITDDDEFGWAKPRIYRYNTAYDNMTNIFTDSYHVDPCTDDSFHLGRLGYAWRSGFINNISSKAIETNTISSYRYTLPFDRRTMNDVSKISDSTKQDLLDFIINDVNVYKYMPKELDDENGDITTGTTGTYLGLLSEDFINHESDTECVWTSEMAHLIMRNVVNFGGQHYNEHHYNLPALVCALIAAFQHYVGGNSPNAPSNPGTGDGSGGGSGNISGGFIEAERIDVEGEVNVFGELYVTEKIKCELTTETNTLKVNKIEFSDGSKMITAGTGDGNTPGPGNYATVEYVDSQVGAVLVLKPDILSLLALAPDILSLLALAPDIRKLLANGSGGGTLSGIPIEYIEQENSVQYLGESWVSINDDTHIKGSVVIDGISLLGGGGNGDGLYLEGIAGIQFKDGSFMDTAGGSGSSGSSGGSGPITTKSKYAIFEHTTSNKIETSLIQPTGSTGSIRIAGSIDVDNSISAHTLTIRDPDIIGTMGMIILPDGITFPDGSTLTSAYGVSATSDLSEYATIEALQEEIRTKDEQIADLEARLARLEALLDNNNNQ